MRVLIYAGLFALSTLSLSAVAAESSSTPLVAQCEASGKQFGLNLQIKAQIVLPEKPDRILSLVTTQGEVIVRDGQLAGLLDNPAVGEGKIRYIETVGELHEEKSYLLIVTRMPRPGDPLQGFFLDRGIVHVVKAHLMESDKRFLIFHGQYFEIYEGRCR